MKYAVTVFITCAAAGYAAWQTPVNVGSPVDTDDLEALPTVPADGSYMIFVSDRAGGLGAFDLWRSDYSGGAWQTPVNLGSNVNSSSAESRPHLTEDDTFLYLASEDPGYGAYGAYDIYCCSINADGEVSTKLNLGPEINTADNEAAPVLSPDGNTLYFTSDRTSGGYGLTDVWVSVRSGGSWGTPLNLGGVINGSNADEPTWISDDGNTLVFMSDRPGTYGSMDLWYSVKSGGTWQTPVNFGPTINTVQPELGCSLYCNHGELGGVMYFSSGRDGGEGGFDIWTSTDDGYILVTPASLGSIKAAFR
jgi:Tol biopolymer transport system component